MALAMALLLTFLAPPGPADAAADLHEVVTRKLLTDEDAEKRNVDIQAWLARWNGDEVDEFEFLRRVAVSTLDRDDSGPLAQLLERVRSHGVPLPNYRPVVGHRLMLLGVHWSDAGSWDRAEDLLPTILEYSDDHLSTLWLMGRRGRDHGSDEGLEFLQKVIIPTILSDAAIDDAERVYLLRRLYAVDYTGPRPFVDVEGPSLAGGEISSTDSRGEVLLVMYWASW